VPDVTLFAGPSAHGLPLELLLVDGVRLAPPVRRGDVDRLVGSAAAPGVAIVCDGIFLTEPAVSHAELCRALDAGWQVWGVSSIGAIRAHEMRHEGMRGFGWVFSMFERLDDFTDDEMCLLHFPEPPHFPVSEALVNVRYALETRKRELGIADGAAELLVSALQALWFGDRTEEVIRRLAIDVAHMEPAAIKTLLDWLPSNRIKSIDLAQLMAVRPWLPSAQKSNASARA
jgi:hypothetical protein